jgi:glutamyl-Q tRNA(Asp) synthetase
LQNQANFAWRFRTDIFQSKVPEIGSEQAYEAPVFVANGATNWADRHLGNQSQDVDKSVGDFPLKRSDGCFTYQLAVVVDDAAQGITHVVRGQDLADNTARQILLQRSLGFATPHYLHTPLVWGDNGEKLSKQNGAKALDTAAPLPELNAAAVVFGLTPAPENQADTLESGLGNALASWVNQWRHLYNPQGEPNYTAQPANRI